MIDLLAYGFAGALLYLAGYLRGERDGARGPKMLLETVQAENERLVEANRDYMAMAMPKAVKLSESESHRRRALSPRDRST